MHDQTEPIARAPFDVTLAAPLRVGAPTSVQDTRRARVRPPRPLLHVCLRLPAPASSCILDPLTCPPCLCLGDCRLHIMRSSSTGTDARAAAPSPRCTRTSKGSWTRANASAPRCTPTSTAPRAPARTLLEPSRSRCPRPPPRPVRASRRGLPLSTKTRCKRHVLTSRARARGSPSLARGLSACPPGRAPRGVLPPLRHERNIKPVVFR